MASVAPKLNKRFIPNWLSFDRKAVILLAVFFVAYLPLLTRLGRWLWNRDHYSFFPLALVAVAALIWAAFESPGKQAASVWIRRPLFGLAFASLMAATLLVSPWLAGFSAMFLLAGSIYAVGGPIVAMKALPAWLLLWIVVPIPLSYDRELIVGMQRLATRLSSGILDLMGYYHMVDGVVLTLPANVYQVEEACSGIHSLFSAFLGAILMPIGRLRRWPNKAEKPLSAKYGE